MSLSQALSTGITGLQTHQKCMDNIGNNLANVNTTGFKKGVYQFATLLEQSLRGAMGASAGTGRGSINPIAMGMGAATASINKVFTQGNLENTGNPNDMAIKGKGFFVVSHGDGSAAYTRSGSFHLGEDGALMSIEGLYVQGTMAVKSGSGKISIPQDAKMENIIIPIGSIGGHSQTSEASFTGNLDSKNGASFGTRLFGGTSYPSQGNLQSWMWTDFNGGDPIANSQVDTSWNALENATFAISEKTYQAYSNVLQDVNLNSFGISRYSGDTITDMLPTSDTSYCYQALDTVNKTIVNFDSPMKVADLATIPDIGPGLVPLVEEINTINGGNVQTSAAYGVQVPNRLGRSDGSVANDFTFPAWFYQSTGANMTEAAKFGSYTDADLADPVKVDEIIRATWPNGINGAGWPENVAQLTVHNIPYPGEMYPASLDTPLENLQYLKGKTWIQPYANIKNGETINVSFAKGESTIKADFVYHRPAAGSTLPGQVAYDNEKSYTLGDFMTFLAGDVDEPSVMAQNLTPEMFGYGQVAEWDQAGYEKALQNSKLASTLSNLDTSGGAMGLLSVPPKISEANHGSDAYDSPVESAGAYTRQGVSEVIYKRWNGTEYEDVKAPSFNVSIVSNLGYSNDLKDINVSYKSIQHNTMFTQDSKYQQTKTDNSHAVLTLDFYDSLGNPKAATVHLSMVSQENDFTTWRWYADCIDDTDFKWQADQDGNLSTNLNVGTGLVRFDTNGNFVGGSEYSESDGIVINQGKQGVNDPIWIKVLNGLAPGTLQDLDFSTLTCTASENSFILKSQNGNPPGQLEDFTVSLDGVITGMYDNGRNVEIARLGLAMFPNENGLVAAGSNLFYASPASGDARYSHASTGGSGVIVHQQLETSNVDLSEEFTKLISTERGFQANTRTITTADEMITELLNIKR